MREVRHLEFIKNGMAVFVTQAMEEHLLLCPQIEPALLSTSALVIPPMTE